MESRNSNYYRGRGGQGRGSGNSQRRITYNQSNGGSHTEPDQRQQFENRNHPRGRGRGHYHRGNQQRSQQVFTALIRHGERCDQSENPEELAKITNISDPPLTSVGLEQASQTGKYLRHYLKQKGYQQIVIETSPFIRCIQTAACIAKEIGIKHIRVNYLYCEWLKDKFYPDGCPLRGLIVRNTEPDQLDKEFSLQKILVEDQDDGFKEASKFYPETWPEQFDRAKFMVKQFKYNYFNENKRIAHLVVSHGALVKSFGKYCSGSGNHNLIVPEKVPYCGISGITISNNQFKLVFSGDNVLDKIDHKNIKCKQQDKIQEKEYKRRIQETDKGIKDEQQIQQMTMDDKIEAMQREYQQANNQKSQNYLDDQEECKNT